MSSSAPLPGTQQRRRYSHDACNASAHALRQLESAIIAHTDWLKKLQGNMAFAAPPSALDTHPEAHLHCELGHWFASHLESSLHTHPAYIELQAEHHALHQGAAAMLARFRLSGKQDIYGFAALIGHTRRMHELLQQLQHDIANQDRGGLHVAEAHSTDKLIARLQHIQSSQQQAPACVCLLEIDHAERIQQQYGNATIGAMLRQTLLTIAAHIRPVDWLMHMRDAALLLVLNQTSVAHARSLLERIREATADASVTSEHAVHFAFTLSSGIAALNPGSEPTQVIYQAEQALFAAKGMGGNRVMAAADCRDGAKP